MLKLYFRFRCCPGTGAGPATSGLRWGTFSGRALIAGDIQHKEQDKKARRLIETTLPS